MLGGATIHAGGRGRKPSPGWGEDGAPTAQVPKRGTASGGHLSVYAENLCHLGGVEFGRRNAQGRHRDHPVGLASLENLTNISFVQLRG